MALFVAVLAVAIAARRTRVPYTVGLVIVGLAIGALPGHPRLTFTPDLVMLVFLPALLFAGAWSYPVSQLRRNWLPIALFATFGVIVSIAVSWLVLVRGAGLALPSALLFGAMIAPTDPVAVLAVFRSLRADEEMTSIVEGESLFNDATAVVAFKVTLLVALSAGQAPLLEPVLDAARLIAGGALVGLFVGLSGLLVLRLVDDYLIEALGTVVMAYGSYILAERIATSGLVAVLVTGLVASRIGERLGSFGSTRRSVNQLWEFIAFVANSILFLMVGLAIDPVALRAALVPALWGILAVAVARLVTVYGLSALSGALGRRLPAAWQHVFFLGGLRGALSMALALSLPATLAQRELLVTMVFSVVLFTIVAQGLALGPALTRLALRPQPRPP